jgi:putative Mg2+ transporter-C (MgtC) family protein
MKEGGSVRGLNTAATLWCSAAVGCLSAFGLYTFALVATLAVIGTHLLLRPLAERINRQPYVAPEQEFNYQIEITCREEDEAHVRSVILHAVGPRALTLRALHSEDLNGSQKVRVTAELDSQTKSNSFLEQVVSRLCLEKGVTAASWSLAKEEAT